MCEVNFRKFEDDLIEINDKLKFQDLELIFKDLKSLFDRKGFAADEVYGFVTAFG